MSAAAAAGDRNALARFLSADISSVDSAGTLRDKKAAIEEMPAGNAKVAEEISDYGNSAVAMMDRIGLAIADLLPQEYRGSYAERFS